MWEGGPRVLYTGGQSPGCSITSNEKKEEECGKDSYISWEKKRRTDTFGFTHTRFTLTTSVPLPTFLIIRLPHTHKHLNIIVFTLLHQQRLMSLKKKKKGSLFPTAETISPGDSDPTLSPAVNRSAGRIFRKVVERHRDEIKMDG